jgi:6-phosphofructokinase
MVKTHHIIVLAEGVMGAEEFAAKMKEAGDTSDLRATNLGHVQRGGSPTARDRVLASWMGAHALLNYLKKELVVLLSVSIMKSLLKAQSLVQQKKVLCSVLLKTVKLSSTIHTKLVLILQNLTVLSSNLR